MNPAERSTPTIRRRGWMEGAVSVWLGGLGFLAAAVFGSSAAQAYVGRIEGEWRGRNGTDLTIGAKGLGWAFRGSAGRGWGVDDLLPHTVLFYFDAAPCWFGVTMSADERRMHLSLLLALDHRCRTLDGGYDRLSD